jgi:hypothetical protein
MENPKKPFNYEDWIKARKSEVADFLKENRKFSGTFNEALEDPELWHKARIAYEKDPAFARMLSGVSPDGVRNIDNPAFTKKFIDRLEQLKSTIISEAVTEKGLKEASRYSSPRVIQESPKQVKDILGVKEFKAPSIEGVEGSVLSPSQLGQSSKYTSGRVIPGGSDQLEQILNIKPYSPKDIEPKAFELKGAPVSEMPTAEEIKKDFLRNLMNQKNREAIESGRFETQGELKDISPSPEEMKTRFAIEKNRPEMVQGPAQAPSSTFEDIKRQFIDKVRSERAAQEAATKAKKAADFKANLSYDFDDLSSVLPELDEAVTAPKASEVVDELGRFGSKGAEKALGTAGKVLSSKPVEFLGRGVIAPAATFMEGSKAIKDIKKGEYVDAASSGLGAASGLATMVKSPYALPLAAGSIGIAGGKELGKQQAKLADEGIFFDPITGMTRSEEELPESVRKAPIQVIKRPEPKNEQEINFDNEQTLEDKQLEEELNKDYIPSETDEVPPAEPEMPLTKSSGFSNKLMDILGMPSAYAEEMPQTSPTDQKPKKYNAPPHLLKNMAYLEALKSKVPPSLLLGLLDQESSFNINNPLVVLNDESGARGAGQVTKNTFTDIQKISPYFKNKKHEDLSNMSNPNAIKDQFRSSIAALKVKANRLGIPFTEENLKNPEIQRKLLKRYRGHKNDAINEQYANQVLERVNKYDEILGDYNKKLQEKKGGEKELVLGETPYKAYELASKLYDIVPAPLGRSMIAEKLGLPDISTIRTGLIKKGLSALDLPTKVVSEKDATKIGLPFLPTIKGENITALPASTEPPPIIDEEQIKKELEEETKNKEKSSASLDLIKQLQEESKDDKILKLMAMQNLLQSQAMSPMLKGMALMASGIIGGSNKTPGNFKVLPKLEGMETFDDLQKAPATQLAMQKMMSEDKYEDPNSGVSKAYRRYAAEIFKKLDEDFDESSLEGLSANSVKTLMPMGIKEDNLLLKKLKEATKEEEKEKEGIEKKKKAQDDWLTGASKAVKGITDNYDKLYAAAESAKTMTGKNPAEDITALYGFVKVLDPTSAVKEGEVNLARSISSLMGKAEVLFNSVLRGDRVDTASVNKLKQEILRLEQVGRKTYDRRMTPFREQAKSRGLENRIKNLILTIPEKLKLQFLKKQ